MKHQDKIRELAGCVLDAHGTIKIVEKVLLNEDSDTAIQAVGALTISSKTLRAVTEELEQLAMDVPKGGGE